MRKVGDAGTVTEAERSSRAEKDPRSGVLFLAERRARLNSGSIAPRAGQRRAADAELAGAHSAQL